MAQETTTQNYKLRTIAGTQDNAATAVELANMLNSVFGKGTANMLTADGLTIEYAATNSVEMFIMGYLVGAINAECRVLDRV